MTFTNATFPKCVLSFKINKVEPVESSGPTHPVDRWLETAQTLKNRRGNKRKNFDGKWHQTEEGNR